jgi:hypothetical protein
MRVSHPMDAGQTFCDGLNAVEILLSAACDHYEKTAPTVAAHCNDLYIRIQDGAAVAVTGVVFAPWYAGIASGLAACGCVLGMCQLFGFDVG